MGGGTGDRRDKVGGRGSETGSSCPLYLFRQTQGIALRSERQCCCVVRGIALLSECAQCCSGA